MLATHLDKGLIGALNDALGPDIDPRPRRHLAVHGQALAIEFVEMLPGRPVGHQVGVGDQHAGRVGVGFEDADGLARLNQQGLVIFQSPQGGADLVEAFPIPRRPADTAIDDQLLRPLRHVGVQIVHQHP